MSIHKINKTLRQGYHFKNKEVHCNIFFLLELIPNKKAYKTEKLQICIIWSKLASNYLHDIAIQAQQVKQPIAVHLLCLHAVNHHHGAAVSRLSHWGRLQRVLFLHPVAAAILLVVVTTFLWIAPLLVRGRITLILIVLGHWSTTASWGGWPSLLHTLE